MLRFSDLSIGMKVERRFLFSEEGVRIFSQLVDDHAPVHGDASFAASRGFGGTIVHGFFLSSIFSGMLGEDLPGPLSVINALSLKIHRPVRIGEEVWYRVTVQQISDAVRAVVLNLHATTPMGVIVLNGSSTCSFPT